MTLRRTITWLLAASAVGLSLRALPASGAGPGYDPSDPAQAAAYQHARQLGIQAYVYGYPLLDTARVYRTATSVNVPNGSGGGPVNQFSHIRRLTGPADRTVVAPNHDTLYSMAWLDLRHGPVVAHMPAVRDRFVVFELLDPYTENFANVGSVGHPAGNYAVAPPSWHGRLPPGVRLIRSPYDRVWIIGRTYIQNSADTRNVVRIQNRYALIPLHNWGRRGRPRAPAHPVRRAHQYKVPGTQPGADPLAFFDALGDQLKRFPPPTRDRTLLEQLASVGIGPGLHPSAEDRLGAAVLAGLRDSVGAGAAEVKADVQRAFIAGAPAHNGWLVSGTGTYGTDYVVRAVVDNIGLGAPRSSLAIYPFTVTDRNLHPLTGATRYVAHFSSRYLPFPVRAFWSLTLYDSHGLFVPNSAHRYLINNRSRLHHNPDGSLDIYIQATRPRTTVGRENWLPAPPGSAFRLIMRLYKPTRVSGILSGRTWQPPTVLPCLPGGATADGTPCAT